MENRIVARSFKGQLHKVLLHEQVENGVTINNNLNVDHEDQQFVTFRKVSQIEQKHPWIKARSTCHKTLQATSIIPCEMQTNEAYKCTNSLQQTKLN